MAVYYEQMTAFGNWMPVLASEAPDLCRGGQRIRRSNGTGPRIRGLREIKDSDRTMTLSQLKQLYSPDGMFRSCRRQSARGV
jgi:hypothetical protein